MLDKIIYVIYFSLSGNMPKNSIHNILQNNDSVIYNGSLVKERKRQNYFNLGWDQRKVIKDMIINQIKANKQLNQLLIDHKICINAIEILKSDADATNENEQLEINFIEKTKSELKLENQNFFQNVCMAKDMCYLSDEHYSLFRLLTLLQLKLPSIYHVRKAREELNKSLPTIYKNEHGYYFNAEEKIKWILDKKINALKCQNNTVKICIRGDKTDVGRNESFFNSCFTLPDEGNAAKTAYGQYTLGVYEVQIDDYVTMKEALEETVKTTRDLNKKILIQDKYLDIKWLLSGDMVWHKTERGLNSCASNFPCLKCRSSKNDFAKTNFLKSNNDQENKLRSLEESKIYLLKKDKDKEGYVHPPIFDFIPFEDVIHDTLHEVINIPKLLLNLTHKDLIKVDNSRSTNLDLLKAQQNMFNWLKSIGLKNPFRTKGQNSKDSDPSFMLKSFSGTQFKKISQLLNEKSISHLPNSKNIALLFNNYYRLHQGYTHNYYNDKLDLFQKRIDEWHKLFNEIFHSKHNTPYIHYFKDHLASSIETHGDINNCNIQG